MESAVSRAPLEIWARIFSHVRKTADLYNVVLASRQCRVLALPFLYRHIVLDDPLLLPAFLSAFQNHTVPSDVPLSLIFSVNPDLEYSDVPVVNGHGQIYFHPHPHLPPHVPTVITHQHPRVVPRDRVPRVERDLHPYSTVKYQYHSPQKLAADTPLYRAAALQISAFVNLRSLTLRDTGLQITLLDLLPRLNRLEALHIQACVPFNEWNQPWPADLPAAIAALRRMPITELTLWGTLTVSRNGPHWGASPNRFHLLLAALATARHLRTLRTDIMLFRVLEITEQTHSQGVVLSLPQSLNTLYLRPLRITAITEGEEMQSAVVRYASAIETLSLVLPGNSDLPVAHPTTTSTTFSTSPDVLPQLRSFRGSMHGVVGLLSVREMERIDFVQTPKDAQQLISELESLSSLSHCLRDLRLSVQIWDAEFIPAVAQLFPNLNRLKIGFKDGGPTEDDLIDFGGPLTKFPTLHTIQIYRVLSDMDPSYCPPPRREAAYHDRSLEPTPPSSSPSEALKDEIQKELACTFAYCCRSLREVQLADGYTWRKYERGGRWCRREYGWVDGERVFEVPGEGAR